MSVRKSLFVIAFALASVPPAGADNALPIEAENIDLGEVTGVAYYTVEQDGFHIVTALAEGETGAPIRLVSVLRRGQSVTLSTPQIAGPIEISRKDDSVFISKENVIVKISRSFR